MSAQLLPSGMPVYKRLFDLMITIPGLIILSPILCIISICIWLVEGRPIFFRQARPGLHGKIFTVYKFRTMRIKKDDKGNDLPDAERISPLGRFLRSSSLDELPQLYNILRGEMSLVGPRPLLIAYLNRYTPEQARRHDVIPGIIGWAQVNGRNAISWEEKFRLDVWYVDHFSLWLDIQIFFLSIWKVFIHEGITQPGHASAEEFMGIQGNNQGN